MMKNKIDWSLVPKNSEGFVTYSDIPSFPVRQIVAEAEIVKLEEELAAREKWIPTDKNSLRCSDIRIHLMRLKEIVELA